MSSTETDYIALREAVGELVWLNRFFEELIITFSLLVSVFYDSQSALHIAKNLVFHERIKYIEIDFHFVHDQLQAGLISLHHIRTTNQLAYILTKALTGIKYSAILCKLVVFTIPPT